VQQAGQEGRNGEKKSNGRKRPAAAKNLDKKQWGEQGLRRAVCCFLSGWLPRVSRFSPMLSLPVSGPARPFASSFPFLTALAWFWSKPHTPCSQRKGIVFRRVGIEAVGDDGIWSFSRAETFEAAPARGNLPQEGK